MLHVLADKVTLITGITIQNFYLFQHTRRIYIADRSKIKLSIFINTTTIIFLYANSSFLSFLVFLLFNVAINFSPFFLTFALTGNLAFSIIPVTSLSLFSLCFLVFSLHPRTVQYQLLQLDLIFDMFSALQ